MPDHKKSLTRATSIKKMLSRTVVVMSMYSISQRNAPKCPPSIG
jgi:hypothetical protein